MCVLVLGLQCVLVLWLSCAGAAVCSGDGLRGDGLWWAGLVCGWWLCNVMGRVVGGLVWAGVGWCAFLVVWVCWAGMGGAVDYVSVIGLQHAWKGGLTVGMRLAVNDDGNTVQLLRYSPGTTQVLPRY